MIKAPPYLAEPQVLGEDPGEEATNVAPDAQSPGRWNLEVRVQGLRFRVQGLRFRVQGLQFRM